MQTIERVGGGQALTKLTLSKLAGLYRASRALELTIQASGALEINLVDLSLKESVVQFNSQGRVETE